MEESSEKFEYQKEYLKICGGIPRNISEDVVDFVDESLQGKFIEEYPKKKNIGEYLRVSLVLREFPQESLEEFLMKSLEEFLKVFLQEFLKEYFEKFWKYFRQIVYRSP